MAPRVICTKYASTTGDDSNPGTSSQPFRTVQQLANSLRPGQAGCIRAGTYHEDVKVSQGGRANARVTLTSYPGERATLVGRLWIAEGADYVDITRLNLNGINQNPGLLPSPTVNGNYARFIANDVTNNNTAICFDLGNTVYGIPTGTKILGNRIHNCGTLQPGHNHDHGIYITDAYNTEIAYNAIYDNADRGVQMYPNAQHTKIHHNIIDGNGEGIIFSGDVQDNGKYVTSNSNVAYNNIISNSKVRHDVESWYPSGHPPGKNNLVKNNCVWGGHLGTIDTSAGGFKAQNNLHANPQYVNRGAKDFRLAPHSKCRKLFGGNASNVGAL